MEIWLRQRRGGVGAWTRRTWFFLVLTYAKLGAADDAEKAFDGMRAAGAWEPGDCDAANALLEGLHEDQNKTFRR